MSVKINLTPREMKMSEEILGIYQHICTMKRRDGIGFRGEDSSPAILAAEVYRRAREEEDAQVVNTLTMPGSHLEPGYLIVEGDFKGKMIKSVGEMPSGKTFHPSVRVTFLDGEVQTLTITQRITVLGRHGIPIVHPLPRGTNDQ